MAKRLQYTTTIPWNCFQVAIHYNDHDCIIFAFVLERQSSIRVKVIAFVSKWLYNILYYWKCVKSCRTVVITSTVLHLKPGFTTCRMNTQYDCPYLFIITNRTFVNTWQKASAQRLTTNLLCSSLTVLSCFLSVFASCRFHGQFNAIEIQRVIV